MSITLNTITNPDRLALINSNFSKIAQAINESLLWRNGSTVGETLLTRDVDFNGNQILNAQVGDYSLAEVVAIAAGAQEAADSAAASAAEAADAATQAVSVFTGGLAGPDGYKYVGRCPTVAALRALEPTVTNQLVSVIAYRTGSSVGGGFYQYDSTDTTTVDNGMTCIVTAGGKRYKPVLPDGRMYTSRAGLTTGVDATSSWKIFCQLPIDKVIDSDVYVSGVGILADNTNMSAINGSIIYLTASVSDQVSAGNEGSCLEAGNSSKIYGLKMYGQNFNGAGIFVGGKTDVVIDACEMAQSYAIGVKNYMSTGTKVINCHIHNSRHGVLSQQSFNTFVSNNYVHNISWTVGNNGGGIWSSIDTNLLVIGNTVFDCADVGIDFEGGTGCISRANIVGRCKNGELTFFATSTGITTTVVMGKNSHIGNTCYRDNYAVDKDGNTVSNALTDVGSCMVYGTLDVAQNGEITFEENKVFSVATTGNSLFCFRSRTSDPSGNCRISFRNNKFITYSGYMGTLLDRQDLVFANNELFYSAGTVRTTELRDTRTMKFINNVVTINSGVTTGNNVFLVNTALSTVTGVGLLIGKNIFTGYDGMWIYIDQVNTGRSVTLDNNDFADDTGYTVIPIGIGAGGVIWKASRLRLLRPTATAVNFAAVGVLYQSSFVCMQGTAWLMLAGKQICGYRFSLKCDKSDTMYLSAIDTNGAINTGRFPNALSYATFSGTTVSFTSSSPSQLSAIVEISLDSTPV